MNTQRYRTKTNGDPRATNTIVEFQQFLTSVLDHHHAVPIPASQIQKKAFRL